MRQVRLVYTIQLSSLFLRLKSSLTHINITWTEKEPDITGTLPATSRAHRIVNEARAAAAEASENQAGGNVGLFAVHMELRTPGLKQLKHMERIES